MIASGAPGPDPNLLADQTQSDHILAHAIPPYLNNLDAGKDRYELNMASSMTSSSLHDVQEEKDGS